MDPNQRRIFVFSRASSGCQGNANLQNKNLVTLPAGWNGIDIFFTCHYLQSKSQKGSLEGIFHEVNLHIKYIKKSFFKFKYAPFKTPFDPRREEEHIKTMYPRFSLPFQLGSLDDSLGRGTRAYSFSESEADITTGISNQAELKDNVSEWIDNSPTRLTKEFQVPSNTPYIPGKTIRAQHMIIPNISLSLQKNLQRYTFFDILQRLPQMKSLRH